MGECRGERRRVLEDDEGGEAGEEDGRGCEDVERAADETLTVLVRCRVKDRWPGSGRKRVDVEVEANERRAGRSVLGVRRRRVFAGR